MVKLELFNGYEWIYDRMISFEHYRKIVKLSGNDEGKTWRVQL